MIDIIDQILKFEGGFTDHSADKGGCTNFGITAATLGEWRKLGRDASFVEVQNLTKDEAKEIYTQNYILQPRFNLIEDGALRFLCVDSAVNSGPQRATEWLQEALAITSDGVLGPKTLAAVASCEPSVVYRKLLAIRIKFIGKIVTNNPSQLVFLNGWLNRLVSFI